MQNRCLHWLRVQERIEFKLAMLTYKLLDNQAPSYLRPLIHVADVPGCRALRSANTDRMMVTVICQQLSFPGCCTLCVEQAA